MASFTVPCPKIFPLLAASSRSSQKRQCVASFLRSESKLNPPSMPVEFQRNSRNQSNVIKVCAQLDEVALERTLNSVPPLDKVLAREPKIQYEIPDASSISVFMNQVSDLIKLVDSRDISELQLKQMDCELVIRKKEALPQPSAAVHVFSAPPSMHQTMLPPQLPSPASVPSPTSVGSVSTTPTSLPAFAKP